MKLNLGCGADYREGFINIDGSDKLSAVDLILDLNSNSLCEHFESETVELVIAFDIIEHLFRWQAIGVVGDIFAILRPGGRAKIRVPDAEYLLNGSGMSTEARLAYLFGGQDRPRGRSQAMNESRKKHPEYFCHKFGWTRESMSKVLQQAGFSTVSSKRAGNDFVASAVK